MTMHMRSRRKNRAGFTLVELMVVISIIAILAAIVGVNLLGAVDEGNVAAAKGQIQIFKTAVINYRLKHKKFPSSLDQLIQGEQKFLDATRIPEDPWGTPYQYSSQGARSFKIVSYGRDGAQGGSGLDADISSDNLQGD